MLFSRLLRRAERIHATYHPEICVLEDRVVPTLLRSFGPTAPPANVPTHLLVIAPADVQAGTPTNVVVEALNSQNHLATGYRGNVQIALGSADPGAVAPAGFTFSAGDKGKHTIQVTFETSGPQTVMATSGGLAAQAPLTVSSVVTHFAVYAVSQAIRGLSGLRPGGRPRCQQQHRGGLPRHRPLHRHRCVRAAARQLHVPGRRQRQPRLRHLLCVGRRANAHRDRYRQSRDRRLASASTSARM